MADIQAFLVLDHKADAEEGDHSLLIFIPDPEADNSGWAFGDPGALFKLTVNSTLGALFTEGDKLTVDASKVVGP